MFSPVLFSEQSLVIPYAWKDAELWLLTGRKKRGFGEGEIVFPGGKPLDGEASKQTACREMFEETGFTVQPEDLHFLGRLVLNANESDESQVHIFGADLTPSTQVDRTQETNTHSTDLVNLQWKKADRDFDVTECPIDYTGWLSFALTVIERRSPNSHFISAIKRDVCGLLSQQTLLFEGNRMIAALPILSYKV